ncbi:MAG: hypothetical protein ACRDS9_16625, partial [Pseudonocardiaceae bacterium]
MSCTAADGQPSDDAQDAYELLVRELRRRARMEVTDPKLVAAVNATAGRGRLPDEDDLMAADALLSLVHD